MLRNAINLMSLLAVPRAFASGVTRITDIVVPEVFSPYVRNLTAEKSNLIQSGAVVSDESLANVLSGGGLTFNEPSFKDLDNDAENISTDDPSTDSSPNKIGTLTEIQVRLSRNNSWSSMDLAATLAGADPMLAIADRVAAYWTRRMQAAFIATMTGVFADNDANDSADYTNDISGDAGGAYSDGVTNFSAEAYLDAKVTMGDSMDVLSMVMMHSIVYNRALKNNLIDFIPDSSNAGATDIATFLGARVIVDDGITNSSGVFHTWLFGAGAVRWGNGSAAVPTEVYRAPAAGTGSGQDVLHSRVEWCIHPVGHAYTGTAASGGPSNAATSNNLAAAGSWNRVFPERKQIKIARLITREY
jgi:hypothetical protein